MSDKGGQSGNHNAQYFMFFNIVYILGKTLFILEIPCNETHKLSEMLSWKV